MSLKSLATEIESAINVYDSKIYFAVLKCNCTKKIRKTEDTFYFTTDDELLYNKFYYDFGPLNISCLFKYCCKMNCYLEWAKGMKKIVHFTSCNLEKKSNAAFLMGSFCIIYLNMHPKDVYKMINQLGPFKSFLDASQSPHIFTLKLYDCYQAIMKGMIFNFFDFYDFNVDEYDTHDLLEKGDMNWIIPRKFLALISPTDNDYQSGHPPEFYFKYFLKNDIKTVIRLNSPRYEASVFNQIGIDHYDLMFPDGSTPPRDILMKFLKITENAPAGIAVHCKAGLGRTGSLVGAYIIKHYRMTARETIAWLRICRPGSVLGQQQAWLEKVESWLWRSGNQYRCKCYGDPDNIPAHKYGIYSKQWPRRREKLIKDARKRAHSLLFMDISKRNSTSYEELDTNGKSSKLSKVQNSFPRNHTISNLTKLLSSVNGLGNRKATAESIPSQSSSPSSDLPSIIMSHGRLNNLTANKPSNLSMNQGGVVKKSQGDRLLEIKAARCRKEKQTNFNPNQSRSKLNSRMR